MWLRLPCLCASPLLQVLQQRQGLRQLLHRSQRVCHKPPGALATGESSKPPGELDVRQWPGNQAEVSERKKRTVAPSRECDRPYQTPPQARESTKELRRRGAAQEASE